MSVVVFYRVAQVCPPSLQFFDFGCDLTAYLCICCFFNESCTHFMEYLSVLRKRIISSAPLNEYSILFLSKVPSMIFDSSYRQQDIADIICCL